MFGKSLVELMNQDNYPKVIVDCVEILRKRGLNEEGLFRKSASSSDIKELRRCYDDGEYVDLELQDSITIAVLLKHFFHELPQPIFPVEFYSIIEQIPIRESIEDQIKYIQTNLLSKIHPTTLKLLRYVFGLLHQVALNSEKNLMTSQNLSIVWAPNLIHGPDPIQDMKISYGNNESGSVGTFIRLSIEYYYQVFQVDQIEIVERSDDKLDRSLNHTVDESIRRMVSTPNIHTSERDRPISMITSSTVAVRNVDVRHSIPSWVHPSPSPRE
jgi:hypothetical protein